MTEKKRNSNIELLRIVLMLMIILHHLIVHGCGLSLLSMDQHPEKHNTAVMLLVNSFLILAVDAYIFISAYYGVKFSLKGLISFIMQATFYSATIYIIACFTGWEGWSLPNLYRSLIPILSGKWWFLSGYILLFILSPIINIGLDSINKKQHLFIAIALLVIGGSYYITNFSPDSLRVNSSTIGLFLIIYICGRYIRKYPLDIKYPLLGYIITSLVIFGGVFFYYKFISYQLAWNIFGYTNPIIILSAICLFFTFKKLDINSAIINKVSVLTFGVYLIHDADPARRFLKSMIEQIEIENTGLLLLTILGIAIFIFAVCACIEKIRQIIFNPVVNKITEIKFIKDLNL